MKQPNEITVTLDADVVEMMEKAGVSDPAELVNLSLARWAFHREDSFLREE